MAFDPTFAAAYIDGGECTHLLGVKVRPFCLWHLLLLQTLDSPFVRNGYASSFHLRTAVGICRLGYRQSKIHRPLCFILGEKNLKKHNTHFLNYVGIYLNKPEYNIIPPDNPTGKAPTRITPPPTTVMTAFEAAYGARCSIKQAWEMPIGEAYIAQAMYLRTQGCMVDFMNQEERLFQREMIAAGLK